LGASLPFLIAKNFSNTLLLVEIADNFLSDRVND